MSLRTESSHDYQTANPLKNSRCRKFPRPRRAPSYWLWHVILHFFNCIAAFSQGLSWLIKNLSICGERTLLANVFYHEAGVIILEEVMFGAVSTTHIAIYKKTLCLQELPGPWACFDTGHDKQHLLLKLICYLRWFWELCVYSVLGRHKWLKIL